MSQLPNLGGPPPRGLDAREALSIPSLLLILFGALGVVMALLSVALYASGGRTLAPVLDLLKDLPPEARQQLGEGLKGSPLNYAQTFVSLLANAFIAFGALQMRNVRSYGLALAAAIVSMVPCLSCCCCLGLPIGIWAITIMAKPEVKAQFT